MKYHSRNDWGKTITAKIRYLCSILFCCIALAGQAQDKTVNIGIITDCVNPRAVAYAQQMVEEARVLLKNNYQVLVADEHILQGDCSAETARRNLEQLLADESVDLIIGADIIVSHIMAKGGPYNKPVLASTVVNIQVQQLPMNKKGQSGVENLAYLELPLSPMRDLEVFNRLFGFENLAVVIDEAAFTGIPELKAFFDEGINSLGLKYSFVFTEATAEATLNKLNGQDAVYLASIGNDVGKTMLIGIE